MLRFNQDRTCVAVAAPETDTPPVIYHCDPFGPSWIGQEPTVLVEQLFSTSLVAVVTVKYRNQVSIINTKKNRVICELPFVETVQDVHMNRKHLIVLLQTELHVYDVSCMKLLKKISTTGKICDFSISDVSVLAYQREAPVNGKEEDSDIRSGDVIIYDAVNLAPIAIVNCHIASIAKLALNNNGNLLATVSEKGTLVRVFNTRTGIRLCEFRRGSLPTKITSLVFNTQNTIVACSSSSGSIHIFTLPQNVTELALLSAQATPVAKPDADATPKQPRPSTSELPQTELVTDAESDELHRLLSKVAQSSLTNMLWKTSKQYINLPKSATPTLKQPHIIIRLPSKGNHCTITIANNTCWAVTPSTLYQYTLPTASSQALAVLQATHSLTLP